MGKEFDDAAAKIIKTPSFAGELYFENAEEYWRKEKYRRSIAELRQGLSLNPQSPQLLLSLGKKFSVLYDGKGTYCTLANTVDTFDKALQASAIEAYRKTLLREEILIEYANFSIQELAKQRDTDRQYQMRRKVEQELFVHLKENGLKTPILVALSHLYGVEKDAGKAAACLHACQNLPDCTDEVRTKYRAVMATFQPYRVESNWGEMRLTINQVPAPAIP